MIEVRITLVPGGDRSQARDLHVFTVANESQLAEISDYSIRCGDVRAEVQHARSDGVLALVERVIYKLRRRGLR